MEVRKPDVADRVPIHPDAAAGLTRRYRAQQAAEAEVAAFLAGILATLGIDPATVTGFDDVAGELILAPPADE